MVLIESSEGGLPTPEMSDGEEARSLLWLLEVGVEGVPVLVPVLDSEVLTLEEREDMPSPEKQEEKPAETVLVAGLACNATSGCGTDCECSPGTCCSFCRVMTDWLVSEGGTSSGCWEGTDVGGR